MLFTVIEHLLIGWAIKLDTKNLKKKYSLILKKKKHTSSVKRVLLDTWNLGTI